MIGTVFLAALFQQGFGFRIFASGKIAIAFFEAELCQVVFVDYSFVDFIELLQHFFVLLGGKIVHAQVIMSLGYKGVDRILADKVAKQESSILIAQFGGAQTQIKIGFSFRCNSRI